MDYATILDTIENSLLSAAEYRLARRLLDGVSNQWTVYLTREQACTLCGTETWAGARKMLNRLADAGIIQLHTNNCAYITFLDRAEMGTSCSQNDAQRAETTRPELTEPRQNDAPARQNDAKRAEMARPLIGRLGRKVGRDTGTNLPTLEGGLGETAPEPADAARSAALLVDVGLAEGLAIDLARRHPFEEIRRQVFQYARDLEKQHGNKPEGPGVIPGRLKRHHPAKIEESDLATPLWQRHHSEEETAAWSAAENRRKYIPDEYSDIIMG